MTEYNRKPKLKWVGGESRYAYVTHIKGESPKEKMPHQSSPAIKGRGGRVVVPAQFMKDPESSEFSQGDRREYLYTIDSRNRMHDINVSATDNPYPLSTLSTRDINRGHAAPKTGRTKSAKHQSRGVRQKHHLEDDPKIRKLNQDGRIGADGRYRAGRESFYNGYKKPKLILEFTPELKWQYVMEGKHMVLANMPDPIQSFYWQRGVYRIRVFVASHLSGDKIKIEYRAELHEEQVFRSRNLGSRKYQIVHKLRVFGYGKTKHEAVNAMLRYPALFHPETNSKWSVAKAFESVCIVFPEDIGKKPLPQKAYHNISFSHTKIEWRREENPGFVPQPVKFADRKLPRSMYTPKHKLADEQKSETVIIKDEWVDKPTKKYGNVPSVETLPDGSIIHINVAATIHNWKELDRITGK